nr:hypothetical protein [Ardenticatena sp.]
MADRQLLRLPQPDLLPRAQQLGLQQAVYRLATGLIRLECFFPRPSLEGRAAPVACRTQGHFRRYFQATLDSLLPVGDGVFQVLEGAGAGVAVAQAVGQVVEHCGPVGVAFWREVDGLLPELKRLVQVRELASRPIAPQVGAGGVVPRGQAEALVGLLESGVVQDALPRGHGLVQGGRVAGLEVALFALLGAAQVGLEFRGNL